MYIFLRFALASLVATALLYLVVWQVVKRHSPDEKNIGFPLFSLLATCLAVPGFFVALLADSILEENAWPIVVGWAISGALIIEGATWGKPFKLALWMDALDDKKFLLPIGNDKAEYHEVSKRQRPYGKNFWAWVLLLLPGLVLALALGYAISG